MIRLTLLVLVTLLVGGPESVPATLALSFLVRLAPGAGAILLRAPGLLGLG